MLQIVENTLRERGLVGARDSVEFNIAIATPQVANIRAVASNGGSFHVKIKESGLFPAEYDNYCAARAAFPKYVPNPIAQFHTDGRELLIFEGIVHEPLKVGAIRANTNGIMHKVVRYFEQSRNTAKISHDGPGHAEFLTGLLTRAPSRHAAGILQAWNRSEQLSQIPRIRQHCDLAIPNLGLSKSELIVFDWEDFGAAELAGLDLFTLMLSDAYFDPALFRAAPDRAVRLRQAYGDFIDRSCQALGLGVDLFIELIPLYLVIFRDLKRHYGAGIKANIDRLQGDDSPTTTAALLHTA